MREGSIGTIRTSACLSAAMLLGACSGSDDGAPTGGSAGASTGTVDATPWEGFCTATFTAPYDVIDFDERVLTARTGETYLIDDFGAASGEARLFYLTDLGPADFDVSADAAGVLPFTSNCDPTTAEPYYAAFTDVTLYADEELTTELCSIERGSALPATGDMRGYAATSFGFSGPATYEVFLDAFGPECGGAEVGYVSVPETNALGATTWLVPIVSIFAPG